MANYHYPVYAWTSDTTIAKTNTYGLVCNMGASWFYALREEFAKPYFPQLGWFVNKERRDLQTPAIYPPANQVFAWTWPCDITDVKVVILGQDPYHGQNQAHGLCFSVPPGVRVPPSLRNIYMELYNDIEGFPSPELLQGYLMGWAEQGVLLLNSVLTVRAGMPLSHAGEGWEQFTDSVITWLNRNLHGVVFLLWGEYAQTKGKLIDKVCVTECGLFEVCEHRHHVLEASHPSAHTGLKPFLGCTHFSHTNELLLKQGKAPIDWTRLPLMFRA